MEWSDWRSPISRQLQPDHDFQLALGDPAFFLLCAEDGTISEWNPNVDGTSAIVEVNIYPDAVYKGMALASASGANYLYVANFRGGTIDVFHKFHVTKK